MVANFVSFIFSWYNLPFTILLCLGVFLAALQLIGLGGEHDSEADADLGHDIDLDHSVDLDHGMDVDHAVDIDHDVAIDHDMDLGHDGADLSHDGGVDHEVSPAGHEVEPGSAGGSSLSLLAFLGVGKAPLMVVLLLLFDLVGMAGWIFNGVAHSVFPAYPAALFIPVLLAALVAGGVISSRITRFIGQALPPVSTTATRAMALVGMRGTVISPFVDQQYGQVHLRNLDGTLITLFAVNEGPEIIRRGDEVVLVSYDADKRRYTVIHSTRR